LGARNEYDITPHHINNLIATGEKVRSERFCFQ
jgi:hypothetical protein